MHRKTLIAWLRDAHAMETHSLTMLRRQAHDPHELVHARLRFEEHFRDTERHVERLGDALRALGATPSMEHTSSDPHGILKTVPASRCGDVIVKTALTRFAAEQIEVAAYTALIAAAEHVGESEVARLCRLNRSEDEEMAEWLDAQIAIVTVAMLGGTH